MSIYAEKNCVDYSPEKLETEMKKIERKVSVLPKMSSCSRIDSDKCIGDEQKPEKCTKETTIKQEESIDTEDVQSAGTSLDKNEIVSEVNESADSILKIKVVDAFTNNGNVGDYRKCDLEKTAIMSVYVEENCVDYSPEKLQTEIVKIENKVSVLLIVPSSSRIDSDTCIDDEQKPEKCIKDTAMEKQESIGPEDLQNVETSLDKNEILSEVDESNDSILRIEVVDTFSSNRNIVDNRKSDLEKTTMSMYTEKDSTDHSPEEFDPEIEKISYNVPVLFEIPSSSSRINSEESAGNKQQSEECSKDTTIEVQEAIYREDLQNVETSLNKTKIYSEVNKIGDSVLENEVVDVVIINENIGLTSPESSLLPLNTDLGFGNYEEQIDEKKLKVIEEVNNNLNEIDYNNVEFLIIGHESLVEYIDKDAELLREETSLTKFNSSKNSDFSLNNSDECLTDISDGRLIIDENVLSPNNLDQPKSSKPKIIDVVVLQPGYTLGELQNKKENVDPPDLRTSKFNEKIVILPSGSSTTETSPRIVVNDSSCSENVFEDYDFEQLEDFSLLENEEDTEITDADYLPGDEGSDDDDETDHDEDVPAEQTLNVLEAHTSQDSSLNTSSFSSSFGTQ